MKFFTISRIRQAIGHLNAFNSGWVIGPLVYIANRIDQDVFRSIRGFVGTDKFLDEFFHPALIELPTKGDRESIRPIFKEMDKGRFDIANPAKDVISHQATRIWGNVYSRTWSDLLKKTGVVEEDPAQKDFLRLKPTPGGGPLRFTQELNNSLPANFCFEELLVWLHAFSGFNDHVDGWEALWADFATRHLQGHAEIPDAYASRFRIRQGEEAVPWVEADRIADSVPHPVFWTRSCTMRRA